MRARLAFAAALITSLVAACSAGNGGSGGAGTGAASSSSGSSSGDTNVGGLHVGGSGGSGGVGQFDGCHNVDVLFAIDDSGSMGEKQQALAQAFPGFAAAMKQKLAKAVSYHVGVVTSDDYYANPAGCQEIGDLIEYTGGPDSTNAMCGPFSGGHAWIDGADPDLATRFQCVAKVGAGGADDERQMRGILNAVQPARNAAGACNEGFARADSLLIIVMITDEDDAADLGCDPTMGQCQMGSGGTSTDWFNELVGYRGGIADNVVVLSLVNKSGTCAGSIGAHELGFTLKFKHGVVGDVCTLDYAQFFADALPEIGAACQQYTPPK